MLQNCKTLKLAMTFTLVMTGTAISASTDNPPTKLENLAKGTVFKPKREIRIEANTVYTRLTSEPNCYLIHQKSADTRKLNSETILSLPMPGHVGDLLWESNTDRTVLGFVEVVTLPLSSPGGFVANLQCMGRLVTNDERRAWHVDIIEGYLPDPDINCNVGNEPRTVKRPTCFALSKRVSVSAKDLESVFEVHAPSPVIIHYDLAGTK